MSNYQKQPEGGLLQSKEWADFLRAERKKVVEISDSESEIFGVIHKLPIVGNYLYLPRMQKEKGIMRIIAEAKKNNCGWVRMDIGNKKMLTDMEKKIGGLFKIKKAPHNMQPQENLIIIIALSEENLLAQMKSKTRYNLKLAERKGVEIFSKKFTDDKFNFYLQKFYKLVEATAKRKKVRFYNFSHYQKMFASLPTKNILLYLARYKGEIIAVNIISFYNGTATYLHGATANKYRNVMAPFLLQWQTIKDAKKRNCEWYDFGGVFPNADDNGKKGISKFKIGFSPLTKNFITLGSYDIVLNSPKYFLYKIIRKIK